MRALFFMVLFIRRWFINLLIIFFAIFSIISAEQGDTAKNFQDALRLIKEEKLVGKAAKAIEQDTKFKDLPGYNSNPSQTELYHRSSEEIKGEASKEFEKNDYGKSIKKSLDDRPDYEINPDDPEIIRLRYIEQHADDINRGKDPNCKKVPKECKKTYSEHRCFKANRFEKITCTKELIVDTENSVEVEKNITLHVGASSKYKKQKVKLTVDFATGRITVLSGAAVSDVVVTLSEALGERLRDDINYVVRYDGFELWQPSGLKGKYTAKSPTITPATRENRFIANFIFPARPKGLFSPITKTGTVLKYNIRYRVPKEYWTNNCLALEKLASQGIYNLISTACPKGRETRIINGNLITRDCWQQTFTYQLKNTSGLKDECEPLKARGCEQMGSQCVDKIKGTDGTEFCIKYEHFYRCLKNQDCTSEIICGKGFFCMDSDCSEKNASEYPKEEFGKDISRFAAVDAAAQDVLNSQDAKGTSIFSGKVMKCDTLPLGAKDCCVDKGWLPVGCNDQERELRKAKEKKLVIKVGKYCAKKVGVCIKHKTSYCVFNSKLARIVQKQGRQEQLKISFGKKKHPICRGLTPDELGRLNFGAMDFSEVVEDIKGGIRTPQNNDIGDKAKKRVDDFYKRGVPRD